MSPFHLLIHESVHATLCIVAAILTYIIILRKTKLTKKLKWLVVAGAFLGGFFIDLDHLIDHFIAFGFNFDLFSFLQGSSFELTRKVYVFFHAWEFLPLFLLIIWKTKDKNFKYFMIAFTLGFISHLLFDTYANNINIGYFLLYRILHNFDAEHLIIMP